MSYLFLSLSIANPHDVPVWNQMASIKSNILKRWDTAATEVRICCIKFVQKVVQVQTPGVIADPRVSNCPTAPRVEHSTDAIHSVQIKTKLPLP